MGLYVCIPGSSKQDVEKNNDSDYILKVKVTIKGVEEEKYLDEVDFDNTADRYDSYINDAHKSN